MIHALRTLAELNQLVEQRIPEGSALEYKRELNLSERAARLELLKDLSGMGNGGGGTIVFGLDETRDTDLSVAGSISALSDPGLPGVMVDIVRAGVRPPLLFESFVVKATDGFVLVVEVSRSPLGPYMVEGYRDWRYYSRSGSSTAPMTEQQVRDAYLLASRGRMDRRETWMNHQLPIEKEGDGPWLSLSGIPEEPLSDLFDPGDIQPTSFRPPQTWKFFLELGGLDSIVDRMARWADGVFAHDGFDGRGPTTALRIHRDGSIGIAVQIESPLRPVSIARAGDAIAAYMGWVWDCLGVRAPIELKISLDVAGANLYTGDAFGRQHGIQEPPGASVTSISTSTELLGRGLVDASNRHEIIARFSDRLFQAYGLTRAGMFRSGQLYGKEGAPLGLSIAGNGIWGNDGRQLAYLCTDGSIRNMTHQAVVGFFLNGTVVDETGNAMATIEMALGPACPAQFIPMTLAAFPLASLQSTPGALFEPNEVLTTPTPTRAWSSNSIQQRLGTWRSDAEQ